MKKLFALAFLFFLVVFVPSSWGDLDLDKEVLVIPDTHDIKPYIWNVKRNPRGFELAIGNSVPSTGTNDHFSFEVKREAAIKIKDIHVFITDEDLHTYAHILPMRITDGAYSFDFEPPMTAKYRIEVVFKTDNGWVDLSRDMKLETAAGKKKPAAKPGDEDYSIRIKLYPKKFYAEHVGTFLYEIIYKGKPLTDIDKIDGVDMRFAAWDEKLKEFIYMTPEQNLGGPDVAVSVVFMHSGKHAVFAEFKHNGNIRTIDSVVNVLPEPPQNIGGIEKLKPSE